MLLVNKVFGNKFDIWQTGSIIIFTFILGGHLNFGVFFCGRIVTMGFPERINKFQISEFFFVPRWKGGEIVNVGRGIGVNGSS